jgi:N-acetylmuramoyl-L-alanine amidase
MSLPSGSWPWRTVRRIGLWRHDLFFRWYGWDKGNLAFFVLLGGAVALLGSFGWFAYADHARLIAAEQRQADLTCLARNIYFEARGEPLVGQYGVAEVTMNRVGSPLHSDTMCDVVHEKHWNARLRRYIGAFSWTSSNHSRGRRAKRGREL